MSIKIYTKTGDRGDTSLLGGPRVSKAHIQLAAYGSVDETNAALGFAAATLNDRPEFKKLVQVLRAIQNDLFSLGSQLACADEKLREKLPVLDNDKVHWLEQNIDELEDTLPELREFILPGGDVRASSLHVARTVCRRAEREMIAFFREYPPFREILVQYVNRLSDFLFVAARYVNHQLKNPDTKWQK